VSRNKQPFFADNPKAGSYWGVKTICKRLKCSERTLFKLYRDYRFPMMMWPKGYAQFGTRGTWWTNELLIMKWLLAIHDVQRKQKVKGNPWWKRLQRGHDLIPLGPSGEQKGPRTRG